MLDRIKDLFHAFAVRVSNVTGAPWAFICAVGLIAAWAISGPLFGFSDTWQLVINTTTTIVTFLMVFLIQNTQNRDAAAMHLKLDELIRSIRAARDEVIDLENASEDEIKALRDEFRRMRGRTGKL